jgi:hypothetical protein
MAPLLNTCCVLRPLPVCSSCCCCCSLISESLRAGQLQQAERTLGCALTLAVGSGLAVWGVLEVRRGLQGGGGEVVTHPGQPVQVTIHSLHVSM